ncbi:Eco57I restriction-modification methylase domain-containing protein [Halomarina oriensis]|uniref:site-specific DNA-methyltransferase (adenine-specific) n=1 Tax=Halomarina oriensis TaxID=671145 RepID=A0A6B0GRE3_9EURY|nr:TaqI-like C-terminal specificity domain-containing protein [Halomarina oriensis]MWG36681.1 N-6 DNA methylase [Halomarina oriensis]
MSEQSRPYRTNRDLFSNHYLTNHLRQTEPWQSVDDEEVREAYDEIRTLWEDREGRVDDYNEAQLERNFIRLIFDLLNIPFEIEETVMRNARRPDYGFFPSADAADAAFDRDDFYEEAIAVADAKRWGRKLDTRGEEKRDFENPSYQIHAYLQETPVQWAVLTNGEHWRLYYGPTSHRLDSYYEIDLPEILRYVEEEGNLKDFKDFYLFFQQEAFLPDQSGDCFLDDVYDESSVFAEAIGEDLQENIYEAIRVLAEGFLDTNDDLDEDDLPLIHDSSLIYLYRLIFVLYAESEGRDLLPTENEIYSASYSLNDLKQTVTDKRKATQQHYQTWQTNLWDRLEELFVLIDQGSQGMDIPKDQLYVPAYNGGLFRTNPGPDDSQEALFLASHEADDAHLAEVIELLTRRDADEGDGQVFVDYSSLDERHLGSIYEGLLEYRIDVADEPLTVEDGEYSPAVDDDEVVVPEGDVFLRTDDGERKTTGSYYTPEYVVEYIVDETLGPLVDDIRSDLVSESADTTHEREGFAGEFADRVFDLKVLDPAMGSGHFLVNAVDYLAREIIDAQERQDYQAVESGDEDAISDPTTEDGELRDINWARRKVAQQCLYGVDVNPLATELAKVSLWLRTLAAEQPLAFLDHHLKTGNSLIGSDIEDVLSAENQGTGQTQLTDWMEQARQRALEHVMERFTDLLSIDNETLEDIKEMEEVYEEVRSDALYQHLLAMANVYTAAEFGLLVPDDAEKQMAEALRDDSWSDIENKSWFQEAQTMAEKNSFFHWELEFPVAFYGEGGERVTDAGFDAVIGNPPYVRMEEFKSAKTYLEIEYTTHAARTDLYVYFIEQSLDVLRSQGEYGSIVSNKFIRANYGRTIRKILGESTNVREIVDFGGLPVFPDATVRSSILLTQKTSPTPHPLRYTAIESLSFSSLPEAVEEFGVDVDATNIQDDEWRLVSKSISNLMEKIETDGIQLARFEGGTQVCRGIVTGRNEAFFIDESERQSLIESDSKSEEVIHPLVRGEDIRPYHIGSTESHIIYLTEETNIDRYPAVEEHLEEYRKGLESRATEQRWFELQQPQEAYIEFFEGSKILYPEIAPETRFAYDKGPLYPNNKCFFIPTDDQYLVAVLNSSLSLFYLQQVVAKLEGSSSDSLYYEFRSQYMEKFPVPNTEKDDGELAALADEMSQLSDRRASLNLNLLDYLGNYSEGANLPNIGIFQPASVNILEETTEEYEKLQVGNVRTTRDGHTVTIEATARYKPGDEDAFETDRWGYTETDYVEAFTLSDLTDKEAVLVEAFVPVSVEREIGGFRNNATKTNTLIDRLKGIMLPDINDIEDDLDRYISNKGQAEELDEEIKNINRLIDEAVYNLYDLTEDEIELVEQTVNSDE